MRAAASLSMMLGGSAVLAPLTAAPAVSIITAGRASISLDVRGSDLDVGEAGVRVWIERSAAIVAGYFGANVSVASLADDWVLVHEMTHLALPAVADEQNWLAEGVATYVEGVARVQAGNLTEAQLWHEFRTSMPKGLPQPGDQGLDRTHTWGRTYWGGALFCLLADVEIRTRSDNRRGLQDSLRAIALRGAGMSKEWSVERVLAVGDAASATTVLTELYRTMKDAPFAPDLDALWSDLGVPRSEDTADFVESAPKAAVRRAITHRSGQ